MFVVRVVVPVVVGLLVSGCVGAGGPAPAPSPMCTPEAGGVEFRCSDAEFKAMKARDALYAEAEAVNEKYREIMYRIYREGAPEEIPPELLALIDGSARDEITAIVTELHDKRLTIGKGGIEQAWVRRNLEVLEGSEVSLSVCIEAIDAVVYQDGVAVGRANSFVDHFFFKRVDNEMKIWASQDEEVESCA